MVRKDKNGDSWQYEQDPPIRRVKAHCALDIRRSGIGIPDSICGTLKN